MFIRTYFAINMAKFLKSIFHPTEPRISVRREGDTEEDKSEDPPMTGRRKLSISRSGRLKQANKKRHSLTLVLYGEDNFQPVEKPKSMEYHVDSPANQSPTEPNFDKSQRRRSAEDDTTTEFDNVQNMQLYVAEKPRIDKKTFDVSIPSDGAKSPEEEIDSAFEIIDKS